MTFWEVLMAWFVWNVVGPIVGFVLFLALIILVVTLSSKKEKR